jgi:hypothetical protein
MTHLSRPFQIALVGMCVLVAVWFVALRGHSSGSANTASTATPAASTPAATPSPGAPSAVYHGSAPGIEGLTRDIAKAHGAVEASEKNAKQLEEKSAQASSPTSQATATAGSDASTTTAKSTTSTGAPVSSTRHAAKTHAPAPVKVGSLGAGSAGARATATNAMQVKVEQQLKRDGTVIVLFRNPTGAEDAYDLHQLEFLQAYHKAFGLPQNRHIALDLARANEVASFGSITRSVPISGTPTILIITGSGKTKTLTGLWDAYAIQQAIGEARQ